MPLTYLVNVSPDGMLLTMAMHPSGELVSIGRMDLVVDVLELL